MTKKYTKQSGLLSSIKKKTNPKKKRMKHKSPSSKKPKKKVSRYSLKGMRFGSSRQPSEQAESVKYYGRSRIR